MNTHADKSEENKNQSVANAISQKKSDNNPTFQFVDNRPETVAQRKLQRAINSSPRVQRFKTYPGVADNFSSWQNKPIQKMKSTNEVVQKVIKNIVAPNKEQVAIMDLLNQRNHALVKKFNLESKGTHGTNWIHAISIMQGIKSQVPKEIKTSEVTPPEGGFHVDISESGKAQSHDFALMAAFGQQEEGTPPEFMDSQQKESEFKEHVRQGLGMRKAIILEIWGQKHARPEPRKKTQQKDEDIYRANAHLLVATLKDSL